MQEVSETSSNERGCHVTEQQVEQVWNTRHTRTKQHDDAHHLVQSNTTTHTHTHTHTHTNTHT